MKTTVGIWSNFYVVQVETERTYSCEEGKNSSFNQLCRQHCVRQTVFEKCGCVDPWLLSQYVEPEILDLTHLLCDPHNAEHGKYGLLFVCVSEREREREMERGNWRGRGYS